MTNYILIHLSLRFALFLFLILILLFLVIFPLDTQIFSICFICRAPGACMLCLTVVPKTRCFPEGNTLKRFVHFYNDTLRNPNDFEVKYTVQKNSFSLANKNPRCASNALRDIRICILGNLHLAT